jgi:uncharacterized protein (TIGR02996 family)
MDDRLALMAAIVANPDEDTPRLALADWLDEHGDKYDQARAEFIRLECRLGIPAEDREANEEAEARAYALQQTHAAHWLGPLKAFVKRPWFKRGLLGFLHLTPGVFLKKQTQQLLAEGLPRVGVNVLALSGETKKPGLVAESPALGLVPALMWWDSRMDDNRLKVFAQSPHTGGLSVLVLEKLLCSDTGLKALARSPCFPALKRLRLLSPVHGGRKITAAGVRSLIASKQFPRLDTFALTAMWNVTPKGFCSEPALARLKRLYYQGSRAFAALCRCPHFTSLETLTIDSYSDGLTDEDAAALLENPAFGKLRRLAVRMARHDGLSPGMRARLRERFGDGFSGQPDLLND